MKERSLGDIRVKDGVTAGREDRRVGRLCEESKGKEKERNGYQRPREADRLKGRGADGKGKVVAKGGNSGGGLKPTNILSNQEVYLTAMVVPRTPIAPRNQDKTQDQGNEPTFSTQVGRYCSLYFCQREGRLFCESRGGSFFLILYLFSLQSCEIYYLKKRD